MLLVQQKKTDHNAEISGLEKKIVDTSYYSKFSDETFDAKIKKKIVDESSISNLVKHRKHLWLQVYFALFLRQERVNQNRFFTTKLCIIRQLALQIT